MLHTAVVALFLALAPAALAAPESANGPHSAALYENLDAHAMALDGWELEIRQLEILAERRGDVFRGLRLLDEMRARHLAATEVWSRTPDAIRQHGLQAEFREGTIGRETFIPRSTELADRHQTLTRRDHDAMVAFLDHAEATWPGYGFGAHADDLRREEMVRRLAESL